MALSLIGSPASAFQPSSQPACSMGSEMAPMPVDHSKMDCCGANCMTPCVSAALPPAAVVMDVEFPRPGVWVSPAVELGSIKLGTTDPPPRFEAA
ncbi:MAG: hypothetical protein ABIN41_02470 [Devosia sp.]